MCLEDWRYTYVAVLALFILELVAANGSQLGGGFFGGAGLLRLLLFCRAKSGQPDPVRQATRAAGMISIKGPRVAIPIWSKSVLYIILNPTVAKGPPGAQRPTASMAWSGRCPPCWSGRRDFARFEMTSEFLCAHSGERGYLPHCFLPGIVSECGCSLGFCDF